MGKGLTQTFQRRHTNGQQVQEHAHRRQSPGMCKSKTTKYHFTPAEMARIKTEQNQDHANKCQ